MSSRISEGVRILGTTENLGYMSGALKDFSPDLLSVPEKTQGMPYALFIAAGRFAGSGLWLAMAAGLGAGIF